MQKNENARILIVDDDQAVLHTARIVLKQAFRQILTAGDLAEAMEKLDQPPFDVVLLDMNFSPGDTSGKDGIKMLKRVLERSPETSVIMITAYGDLKLAVEAMKIGAVDFVLKPWESDKLIETVQAALEKRMAKMKGRPQSATPVAGTVDMIGHSAPMKAVMETIKKVAATDANVLILGENGTGKEVAARAIHEQSPRSGKPFVSVDLGAVTASLFESELFGHVKGAFTDAKEDRTGRFEAANGGTLFLDEIGNLPLALQVKLLGALQQRAVVKVGSTKPIAIDIRLVCATNMPLHEMTKAMPNPGFRQDLLYRINTVEVELPPLRQRTGDVTLLLQHFLKIYGEKYQKAGLKILEPTLQQLEAYDWPGNIRELQHAVERAVIMADQPDLQFTDFQIKASQTLADAAESGRMEEVEIETIRKTIRKYQGNISQAARELGLARNTLYRKIKKYGL